MAHPAGEAETGDLRVDFDRRLRLEFHGSRITSDAGLLAFRELDDALGLTGMAGDALADSRTGRNSRHSLMAQFRQSVFGRLAGYEDVNDADRLGVDPAMRWIVGGQAVMGQAASTSQMGRFETEVLAKEANVTALADLSGRWIDVVHARRPTNVVVLDMDSSVSPTHGEQEGTAYNGHFGCTCYHPLFVFNQFGDLERCSLRPGNVHSADGWRDVLEPVVARYRGGAIKRRFFRGDAAFALPDLYAEIARRKTDASDNETPPTARHGQNDPAMARGRKAWLFVGSDRGGERAAMMYTLIATCRLNDVDPLVWLTDVLTRIADISQNRLDELLPWNWKQLREQIDTAQAA